MAQDTLVPIKYFKANAQTHRFRKNQKVWVSHLFANHIWICFKWRGKGRYVSGVIDRWMDKSVGEIKEIEVKASFAEFIVQRGKQ